MKRFANFAIAFVAVAVVAFAIGYGIQWNAVRSANEMAEANAADLARARERAMRQDALLSLYRARVELVRNNFGLAGDHLAEAKRVVEAAGPKEALPAIENATAAVIGQDPAAVDPIQNAIRSLESTGRSNAGGDAP